MWGGISLQEDGDATILHDRKFWLTKMRMGMKNAHLPFGWLTYTSALRSPLRRSSYGWTALLARSCLIRQRREGISYLCCWWRYAVLSYGGEGGDSSRRLAILRTQESRVWFAKSSICDRQQFANQVCKLGPLRGSWRKRAIECLVVTQQRFLRSGFSEKLSQIRAISGCSSPIQ